VGWAASEWRAFNNEGFEGDFGYARRVVRLGSFDELEQTALGLLLSSESLCSKTCVYGEKRR
jgi:hypothetical protein